MSEEKKAYGQILKSSSLVGGAQVINLLIGMVRVKFVAVLLGPSGIGLQGIFMTIQNMALTISGLGLKSSGVRDVAESVGSDDAESIARTVLTLRRICFITGLLGGGSLAILAMPISRLTFKSGDYAVHIAWLGLAVLMGSISAGEMALIQGMRRISDLARLNIITALFGSTIAIGFFWCLGIDGIIPSLLSLATVSLIGSFWFSRRIQIVKVSMTWRESFDEARGLITLGLAFMWSGVLGGSLAYATRTVIAQEINLTAVGVFSAAFALSGMFLNFVLGAMGADFYPSLTAVSDNQKKMRDLVNQQTEVGLLLAVPGLLATLALAPWIIRIFYTVEFTQSADLLQWFVLGCLGRVVSWPMAFIMLAKGRGKTFAFCESIFNLLHFVTIWIGLKWIGLEGVAVAFCLIYVFYTIGVMLISRHLINFRWSPAVWRLLLVLLPIASLTMLQSRYLTLFPATVVGSLMTFFTGIFCLCGLFHRLGPEHKIVRLARKVPLSEYLFNSRS